MIRITDEPWDVMVQHAIETYPNECCGAMLGKVEQDPTTPQPLQRILRAVPLQNIYTGGQEDRYEIKPQDLLRVEREAREAGFSLLGIYHSHPDCDAYFSKTDLENSCPWYTFLVISIRQGKFHEANCFQPNADCTEAPPVALTYPLSNASKGSET
jgi:proteasome lid subunit RPN8/RPN11